MQSFSHHVLFFDLQCLGYEQTKNHKSILSMIKKVKGTFI